MKMLKSIISFSGNLFKSDFPQFQGNLPPKKNTVIPLLNL